jgi:hypothetical protein
MIRKSVKRFSEKIMLKQEPKARCRFIPISSRFRAWLINGFGASGVKRTSTGGPSPLIWSRMTHSGNPEVADDPPTNHTGRMAFRVV